ncbi:MAG: PAS domain-containing protein [Candidatus Sedimenticola endophacoides]
MARSREQPARRVPGIPPQGELPLRMLDALGDPVLCHDREFRVIHANPALLEWLGQEAETLLGKPYWEVCPHIDTPLQVCAEALESGTPRDQRVRLGGEREYRVRAYSLHDDAGAYLFSVLLIRDLTRQHGMESALAHEQALQHAVAALSPALMSMQHSIEHVANLVLEQAKELTGCRHSYVSEIEPLSGDNLVHTFTSMLAQCKVREKRVRFPWGADGRYPGLWGHALSTRKGFYTNTLGEHPQARGTPEGHVVLENFLSAPAKADGRLMGQIALANTPEAFEPWHLDVVEKLAQLYAIAIEYRQKVEQVRSAERRLREIVENQVDGMLVLDQGGRIRFANRATELMQGRQRESLIDHDSSVSLPRERFWDIPVPKNRLANATAVTAPTVPRSSRLRPAHCSKAARAQLRHDDHNDSTACRMRYLYALRHSLSVVTAAIQPRLRLLLAAE